MSFAQKKPYSKPQLTTYGNVEKLTLGGHKANSDAHGTNTAFPNPA